MRYFIVAACMLVSACGQSGPSAEQKALGENIAREIDRTSAERNADYQREMDSLNSASDEFDAALANAGI